MLTTTTIAVGIATLFMLGIVFMVARRLLRFAFKAALVIALLIAFGIAGLVFWFNGGSTSGEHQNTNRAAAHRGTGTH